MKKYILIISALLFGGPAIAATPTPVPTATPVPTPTPAKQPATSKVLGQSIFWGVDSAGTYHPLVCSTNGKLWTIAK